MNDDGEKGALFNENGKHEKGHSTKGQHNIFKKDEYEKKYDFYDEFDESEEKDNDDVYHEHHQAKKGDNYHEESNDYNKNEVKIKNPIKLFTLKIYFFFQFSE